MIEAFFLPKLAAASELPVDTMRGNRFPRLRNLRQRMFTERRDQHVRVVGHDHEIVQPILSSVVMSKRLLDNSPNVRPRQQTLSVPFIEPSLPTIREQPIIFFLLTRSPRLGMRFEPRFPLGYPLIRT